MTKHSNFFNNSSTEANSPIGVYQASLSNSRSKVTFGDLFAEPKKDDAYYSNNFVPLIKTSKRAGKNQA